MYARVIRVLRYTNVAYPFKLYNDLLVERPLTTKCLTSGVLYGGGDLIAQYLEHKPKICDKNINDSVSAVLDIHTNTELSWRRVFVLTFFGAAVGGPAMHYWYNGLTHLPRVLTNLQNVLKNVGKAATKVKPSSSCNIKKRSVESTKSVALPIDTRIIVAQIVIDQLFFAPVYLLTFFLSVGVFTDVLDYLLDRKESNQSNDGDHKDSSVSGHSQQIQNKIESDKLDQSSIDSTINVVNAKNSIVWKDVWLKSYMHTKEVFATTFAIDCAVWPPLQFINFKYIPVRYQFLYVNILNLFYNAFLSHVANTEG